VGLALQDGAVPVVASAGQERWLDLEDGVQIQFEAGGEYRSGDYWLIPARVETGDILWPPPGQGDAALAHGVQHYYAPLAVIDGGPIKSCRRKITPITVNV
jgi:hypothetical protein